MRYAVYFTPPPDAPLTRLAARWLGRDAFGGAVEPLTAAGALGADEIRARTAEPRRYGFHATLKAPFRLDPSQSEEHLIAAFADFCARRPAIEGLRLAVRDLDGFIALLPAAPCPELDALAGDALAAFERFRAPLSEAEIARRNPDGLSPGKRENLLRWGYPHVLDAFSFHMTLTGPVAPVEMAEVLGTLQDLFNAVTETPLPVDGLALFLEPEPGADFSVFKYYGLSGQGRGPDRAQRHGAKRAEQTCSE